MQKLILLVVGATWIAVLVPPLLRQRGDNRPNSSVDHFRRHLITLQKTVPSRGHGMHSLARPLAGARPSLGAPYQGVRRSGSDVAMGRPTLQKRVMPARATSPAATRSATRDVPQTTRLTRRTTRSQPAPRRRDTVRMRRQQVVRVLLFVTLTSGALALLVGSSAVWYVCAFCALSLFGYSATLLRIRRDREMAGHDSLQPAA